MVHTHAPRILAPKLRPPVSHQQPLHRPRLLETLLEPGGYRVGLVQAPAGAGKTTVLAQFYHALARSGEAVAWLSLDGYDDNLPRFLHAVLAAVAGAVPALGAEARQLLTADPELPAGEVLASLIDDWLAYGRPFTLILDDYHELQASEIHRALDFLLRYLPANLRLVLGARDVPPLSLARLRVQGLLLELRWEDLRFTAAETASYLRGKHSLCLDDGQIDTLNARAEGWIAGLQLAAVSLRGHPDPEGFVGAFSGAQAEVADYLLDDVYRRQPPTLQRFLLRTSVLERLCAPLCNELTGEQDAQRRLEQLDQANLFIFGLDPARHWFRYHHLFRDFLRNRLQTSEPQLYAELLLQASRWYQAQGQSFEALAYAISGGWFEPAAALLEEAGRPLVYGCDFKELRDWVERLPRALVRERPQLALLYGWSLAYQGEFEAAREAMAWAAAGAADNAGGGLQAELGVLRTVTAVVQTDEPDLDEFDPCLPRRFGLDQRLLRALAHIVLGYGLRARHRLDEALTEAEAAIALSDDTQGSFVNLLARFNHGTVLYLQGRLAEAEVSLRGSLAHAERRRWSRSMALAFVRVQLAMVLQTWGRWKAALAELDQAVELLEASQNYGFMGIAYTERCVCLRALGRAEEAAADLARAGEVARRHHVTRARRRHQLVAARIALETGELDAARGLLEAVPVPALPQQGVLSEQQEAWLLVQLRLLQAEGDRTGLAAAAVRGEASAAGAGRVLHQVEFLLWRAAAEEGEGNQGRALGHLQQAVELARPGRLWRPFLLLPPARRERLARELDAPWLGSEAAGGAQGQAAAPELHPRELQILRLLAEGLRNRGVAERLFLSEETVKWYLKRLYLKLEVRTRTEAVSRGRALKLIA